MAHRRRSGLQWGMRFASLIVLALAACSDGSGFDDDYPVLPPGGGGGGGGPTTPDAGPPADASTTIMGRVCVVSDLRSWTANCGTDVAGLTVAVGAEMATTGATGEFTIARATGTGLQVRVSGTGIVTSLSPYDPATSSLQLVAPTEAHWAEIQAATPIALTAGNGSVMAHVTLDGAAAPGITGECDPIVGAGVFYDEATSPVIWATDESDSGGKVLCADLAVGTVTVTADRLNAMFETLDVEVEADAITFATMDLMPLP
jgi:hypothetical protein